LDRRVFIVNMAPIPAEAVKAALAGFVPDVQIEVESLDPEDREGALHLFGRADIVLGDYTFVKPITAEMIGAASRLKLIAQGSTGYQHIDIEACRAAGIPVVNTAGANAIAVAEQAIMFILCLMKKTLYAHHRTAGGFWGQAEMFGKGLREFYGKTLGIVGVGRIGRELIQRARCFGCEMIYYDPQRLDPAEESALGISFRDMDTLLAVSDVVSLHVPLTSETQNMIGERELASMKQGALLLNLARGEVVDEAALAAALRSGHLGGAGLDVFAKEPFNPDNPLLQLDNVVLSPHIGGTTDESRLRMMHMTFENMRRVLNGEKPENVVNGVS
jgi:glyoxylate reductase